MRAAIGTKHFAPQLPRFLPMAKAAWSESALEVKRDRRSAFSQWVAKDCEA